MIDYQEIVNKLELDKVKQLLTSFNIPFKENDVALIMPTVCHNDDVNEASWKLYYYKDKHFFYCYTEDGGMSIFKFLQHYYETRQISYDWYNDILQVVQNCSASSIMDTGFSTYHAQRENYKVTKQLRELPQYDDHVLDCFVHAYPSEWLSDGISREAIDKYNIKYSISQNKIIIPHYDISGRLVGVRGRALNDNEIELFGKYAPVQVEGQWYSHPLSLNLYGLNFNWQNIKQSGIVYVFESEKSVLQCDSFSQPNCAVAVCGSSFNKFQLALLLKHCAPREVVICFDREELPYERKYYNKLYKMGKKYINYAQISFVYDQSEFTNLKDSPSDHGEEIFYKLLSKRIIIK